MRIIIEKVAKIMKGWLLLSKKCRAPKTTLLLCREKARYFNDIFLQQCKLVINNSVLPTLTFLTDKRINYVTIENDEIISLIRKINPNKAAGSASIFLYM